MKSQGSYEKNKILISHVDDIHNIYHLFVGEIDAIWKETLGDPSYSILLKHYTDDPPGRWRRALLKLMYREVYIGDVPADLVFDEVREIKTWSYGMVDNETFRHVEPSLFHISMADKLKDICGLRRAAGNKVLYVERERSRILFDFKSKISLGKFLTSKCGDFNINFSVANFDDATFQTQMQALSDATIMLSCHGAANTNLFLLPKDATLLEVNFRRYWFCDPVCDKHFSGEISYQTDCGGPLTWKDTFHKAEYHNLSQLYGIKYREFEIEDAEKFLNDNPIEIERIYVDGDEIFRSIYEIINS